jgi:hypothetical protein
MQIEHDGDLLGGKTRGNGDFSPLQNPQRHRMKIIRTNARKYTHKMGK